MAMCSSAIRLNIQHAPSTMATATRGYRDVTRSHACDVNDVSRLPLRVRFKCYVLLATVPVNVTLMSRGRGTLQRSLLALISANGDLDMFELTALAYELEPDEQGKMVVSAAHLASVRRALVVLFREGLAIGSTTRQQGGRRAWAAPEYAGRPWFWMEFDHIEGREPLTKKVDDYAVVDGTMRMGL